MGKKQKAAFAPPNHVHNPGAVKKYHPFVSVCTPTFNRRPFIPIMVECFRAQTYPRDRMEWIIVDDGTDKIKDILELEAPDLKSIIKYFPIEKKLALGAKRNFMHTKSKGSIIVYMDDDDYYPPERVEHAVTMLTNSKDALCAGSSEMYIFFKFDAAMTLANGGKAMEMYQCGPYGPNHATAGTFAFKSRLLDDTRYEDGAALAEEKAFLKNYTVPFVQLDPMKTILVFSHNHNTFDKRKMLENADPNIVRPSSRTVDDFLKTHPKKDKIKRFFMEEIDALLKAYAPGDPSMKPDVLAQTKIIEEKRKQMIMAHQQQQQQQMQQQPFLIMEQAGMAPVQMTQQQTVDFINRQHQEILALRQRILEMERNNGSGSVSTFGSGFSGQPVAAPGQRREMHGPAPEIKIQKQEVKGPGPVFVERSKSDPEVADKGTEAKGTEIQRREVKDQVFVERSKSDPEVAI